MRAYLRVATATALLALLPGLALAQTPSTVPPYNTDLGAIITNSNRAAGTVTSSQQDNLDGQGLTCVSMFTTSGGPSVVWKIQGYDAANNAYYDIITTGTLTAPSVAVALTSHTGIIAADAVSPAVPKSLPIPRKWRISQTITGAGTAISGYIGCNKLK